MYTKAKSSNKTTDVVIQQHSRKLLMMSILMSETCWAHRKWNKMASDIRLVFYSSTVTMMHGPMNVSQYPGCCCHTQNSTQCYSVVCFDLLIWNSKTARIVTLSYVLILSFETAKQHAVLLCRMFWSYHLKQQTGYKKTSKRIGIWHCSKLNSNQFILGCNIFILLTYLFHGAESFLSS